MKNHELKSWIVRKATELGFSAVGICAAEPLAESRLLSQWLQQGYQGTMDWLERTREQRGNPTAYFPEAKSIVVVALNYFRKEEALELPPDKGNISIYARGRDYHKVLRSKLKQLLKQIQQRMPQAKGRVCVDSFPIMEKPLAVRAGVGWIGKHTNLILKQKGSYFFLGELLLSLPLPPDEVFSEDYCGTCNRCQVSCPTGALDEPYVLDARKCISYLTIEHQGSIQPELASRMGNWIFGCDICQAVCPWNRFSEGTSERDFYSRFSPADLELSRLSRLTEKDFREIFAGTPVLRTGYRNFRRNVEIALENLKRAPG